MHSFGIFGVKTMQREMNMFAESILNVNLSGEFLAGDIILAVDIS